jgi:SAM-dependent methyltransferase
MGDHTIAIQLQTPGEKCLVKHLADILPSATETAAPPRILNVGAGQSVSIEDQLAHAGRAFIADRVDIESSVVSHPHVGRCWRCPVEAMDAIASESYSAAFAHYLLEHVRGVERAASEIFRVLLPSGVFIATVPNPAAPQFVVARHTPLAFHTFVRGAHAWETLYAYKSIPRLLHIFEAAGFRAVDVQQRSFIQQYAVRAPFLMPAARLYDRVLNALHLTPLMGDACLVFAKG